MQGIAAIGVEKYKNFLGENTPRPPPRPPPPQQTFCYQQTIYHFSTLGIVWSLFVDGPPTDEFLKNALYFIKSSIHSIAPIILRICNMSIENGVFPNMWKKARLIPIDKAEIRTERNNYRPISILPIPDLNFSNNMLPTHM